MDTFTEYKYKHAIFKDVAEEKISLNTTENLIVYWDLFFIIFL